MNGLDVLLALAALVALIGGWQLGFVRRATSWVGAALGLGAATLLLPKVIGWIGLASDLGIFLAAVAMLVVFATIGQALGAAIGARLHTEVVDSTTSRRVDAVGGSLLGVLGVAVLAWLVVPVMAGTSGWPAAAAYDSSIARFLERHLPDPPPQITELERRLAGGEFPQLFAGLSSAPDIAAPPVGSPVSAEVLERSAPSAVRLSSATCGRLQSGSGFVVAPSLIVTNAHVVAAAEEVTVDTADGATEVGHVVAFDHQVDLALVTASIDRPSLPLAEPSEGDRGLVLGFPGGGPFEPSPFEVGQLMEATGYDIYDRDLVQRDLLALASELAPGDSGSAVLRADGSVIGVAVAIAPDRPEVAYALDIAEVHELLDGLAGATLGAPVDTGPCIR